MAEPERLSLRQVPASLATGGAGDPLLPRILRSIRVASEIDLCVSFVLSSGLDLVFDPLVRAVEGGKEGDERWPGTRLRILTSDYLNVTEPRALRRLMLLAQRGAEIRVFESGRAAFHPKAYIFMGCAHEGQRWDEAFVGSSNLTRSGLTEGIEWNLRVEQNPDSSPSETARFREIRGAFEALFRHEATVPLSFDWIEAYEDRRPHIAPQVVPPADQEAVRLPPPTPHAIQVEALKSLDASRAEGNGRGLVVMATGLGKTWLAAFDAVAMEAKRVLFVAHREEILLQAESTFQRILPKSRVGHYTGSRKEAEADLVFASVQTLARDEHEDAFAPDHFDYVVVDEFHHAAAPTYRRVLSRLQPRFLLGLTATPERTDHSDILSLCDDNLVFRCDLLEGIRRGFLSPFRYFGIWDESVDYREIPWRNGRFDPHALENKLATKKRARHALVEWREKGRRRTLAFCVSRTHADFMAEEFSRNGVAAASVHGTSDWDREKALKALAEGGLEVVFSVDLFNEGVDVPTVDTVLMLRPTESRILFLQQLGRGLRKADGKDDLVVLDFIGNHRSFLAKPLAILGDEAGRGSGEELISRLNSDDLELPPGCFLSFDLEFLDFLKEMVRRTPEGHLHALADALGHRPTAAEFFRDGGDWKKGAWDVPKPERHWWAFLQKEGLLSEAEEACLATHKEFLQEVETSRMTKSYKMILLRTFLDLDGFRKPPRLGELAEAGRWEMARRSRLAHADIPEEYYPLAEVSPKAWLHYWKKNPIRHWLRRKASVESLPFWTDQSGRFQATFSVDPDYIDTLSAMVHELVDYRLAQYRDRKGIEAQEAATASEGERASRPPGLAASADEPAAVGSPREGNGPEWLRLPFFRSLEEVRRVGPDGASPQDRLALVPGGMGDASRLFLLPEDASPNDDLALLLTWEPWDGSGGLPVPERPASYSSLPDKDPEPDRAGADGLTPDDSTSALPARFLARVPVRRQEESP